MEEQGSPTMESYKLERKKVLGFVPQHELYINKFLPYCSDLDVESQRYHKIIKENLARAVAVREVEPGILECSKKLLLYIKLYGLKFSKEDHINYIKLYLNLIVQPELGPLHISTFCIVLKQLLRKSKLISPAELEIDWRPLYNLCKIVLISTGSKGQAYKIHMKSDKRKATTSNSSLINLAKEYGFDLTPYLDNDKQPSNAFHLQSVIQLSSSYFPKDAVKDILDEIYSKLQPLDIGKSCQVFECLPFFLNLHVGYELWFDNFMSIWCTYQNPPWNADMMNIISGLASNQVGYIDWEPHIPIIFTKILRSIELPVTYKGVKSDRNQALWSASCASWIVCVLGPNSSAQKYLNNFMETIETYLHPANFGKWIASLNSLLLQISRMFINRLKNERFKKHSWKRPVPESAKLTDECITAFVKSMAPVAFRAMYSRLNINDVSVLFKILADLRPELIIPEIIDRVYCTLDSLIEPNKMAAALNCLMGVSRALVTGHEGYISGKNHLIPILFATLPGIDSNDFRKTNITLKFITGIAYLVPFVDCSKAGLYYDDLSEEERLLCEQTAEFENFVLQYLDRIFMLVEATAVENIKMEQVDNDNIRSHLENFAEQLIYGCTSSIIMQCSEPIKAAAAKKLIDYITSHILEPRVAAPFIGFMLRVFSRYYNDIFKLLMPFLSQQINTILDEAADINEIDKQSNELFYYLILLSHLVKFNPNYLKPYIMDYILPITDRIFKLQCKTSNKHATNIILHIMSTYSVMHSEPYVCGSKPLNEYLPIRYWGAKMTADEKLDWIVPDEESRVICEQIIYRYLIPILENFELYIDGKKTMTREEINRDLVIILSLLKCKNFLPDWEEEPLMTAKSEVDLIPMIFTIGIDNLHITMPDKSNVLLTIVKMLHKLQIKLLADCEDDTRSINALLYLWKRLLVRRNGNGTFDAQVEGFLVSKQYQDYPLVKGKMKDLRNLLSTRILLQQDGRDEMCETVLTPTHLQVIQNIFSLAVSRYTAVRILAQQKVIAVINQYPNAHKYLVNNFTDILESDSNENHKSFKGCLYLLIRDRKKLICKSDWEFIEKIWLALLKSKPSEKLSIVKLIDSIIQAISQDFYTVPTEMSISDECVDAAVALLGDGHKDIVCAEDIARGKLSLEENNKHIEGVYNSLLNQIVDISTNHSLHWRYNLLASTMVLNCVHPSTNYPISVANLFVHNLIHDSIKERKIATLIVNLIFKQQKREHVKVPLNPFKNQEHVSVMELQPGLREDNEWLQYDPSKFPKNQSDWDEPRYLYKCLGYFGWPKDLQVYAPHSQQPQLDRSLDELNEYEKIFYTFFADKSNLDKLVEFWALEEKKGNDKFNQSRFLLIKLLFNAFGDSLLENFVSYLPTLIENKSIEGNHRCAAQIIAGIIRGAKHWPYDKTVNLYEKLVPIIRLALTNLTVETDFCWGTCFATAAELMDPVKQYWLYEVLFEDPLRQSSSFIECGRLYCLQGAFNQHVWRMNSYAQRLLDYLRPFLNHPFQIVRNRISNTLINIFEGDIRFEHNIPTNAPKIQLIINEIIPKLKILLNDEMRTTVVSLERGDSLDMKVGAVTTVDSEYDVAIRLFKTIAQWLVGILDSCLNGSQVEFFEFLGIACRLERSETDIELANTCTSLLAMLSQALTAPNAMDTVLLKIEEVSKMPWWSTRLAVIDLLQVQVFHNMAILLSNSAWVTKVQEIVLNLLEDPILEVREKAGEVLGGLIHCSFLSATDNLLDLFKKKCRTKVIKRSRNIPSTAMEIDGMENHEANALRIRHTGVLGLCAFISAYPYDVPHFVPNVFEHLGSHMNDPQPISSSIRKTMGDFKRTHHDNWEMHKLKFTEEQLAVLNDLTVPPSYYA